VDIKEKRRKTLLLVSESNNLTDITATQIPGIIASAKKTVEIIKITFEIFFILNIYSSISHFNNIDYSKFSEISTISDSVFPLAT
jgi:hypothetical protein